MCQFSAFNQKISWLSENVAEAVHDMEVQNRNVNLLNENIKILQNELAKKKNKKKNEIIKSPMNSVWFFIFHSTVFDSLSAGGNGQTISDQQQQQQSQQLLKHNQQTMHEQQHYQY